MWGRDLVVKGKNTSQALEEAVGRNRGEVEAERVEHCCERGGEGARGEKGGTERTASQKKKIKKKFPNLLLPMCEALSR
jgi:hypothetical protein